MSVSCKVIQFYCSCISGNSLDDIHSTYTAITWCLSFITLANSWRAILRFNTDLCRHCFGLLIVFCLCNPEKKFLFCSVLFAMNTHWIKLPWTPPADLLQETGNRNLVFYVYYRVDAWQPQLHTSKCCTSLVFPLFFHLRLPSKYGFKLCPSLLLVHFLPSVPPDVCTATLTWFRFRSISQYAIKGSAWLYQHLRYHFMACAHYSIHHIKSQCCETALWNAVQCGESM